MGKLKNNASYSTGGIIYQFYIALDSCFDLIGGETLYIETYGDVTVPGQFQLEAKDLKRSLSEKSKDFWKTLKNWLLPEFCPSHYKKLILHTTQTVSVESKLIDWNELTSKQKLKLLQEVSKKYRDSGRKDEKLLGFMDTVLASSNKNKLLIILGKFIVESDAMDIEALRRKLTEARVMGIPAPNRQAVINSLLGFIQSKMLGDGQGWKITYEEFSEVYGNLTSSYSARSFCFPEVCSEIDETEISNHKKNVFVKKIEEIEYEQEILPAIKDMLRTKKAIVEISQCYSIPYDKLNRYSEKLLDEFERKYRSKKRALEGDNQIRLSQDFYDEIITYATLDKLDPQAEDTPRYFRNGIIHELLDEDENGLRWLVLDDKVH